MESPTPFSTTSAEEYRKNEEFRNLINAVEKFYFFLSYYCQDSEAVREAKASCMALIRDSEAALKPKEKTFPQKCIEGIFPEGIFPKVPEFRERIVEEEFKREFKGQKCSICGGDCVSHGVGRYK